MSASHKRIGWAATTCLVLCVSARPAQCEKVSELLGKSFSISVKDEKTGNSHNVKVQIGKSMDRTVVDYVITFTPPFPEEYGFPSRYVGKGIVINDEKWDDYFRFQNTTPPEGGNYTYIFPKGMELYCKIGGDPDTEFTASGFITLKKHEWGNSRSISSDGKKWEK